MTAEGHLRTPGKGSRLGIPADMNRAEAEKLWLKRSNRPMHQAQTLPQQSPASALCSNTGVVPTRNHFHAAHRTVLCTNANHMACTSARARTVSSARARRPLSPFNYPQLLTLRV